MDKQFRVYMSRDIEEKRLSLPSQCYLISIFLTLIYIADYGLLKFSLLKVYCESFGFMRKYRMFYCFIVIYLQILLLKIFQTLRAKKVYTISTEQMPIGIIYTNNLFYLSYLSLITNLIIKDHVH